MDSLNGMVAKVAGGAGRKGSRALRPANEEFGCD